MTHSVAVDGAPDLAGQAVTSMIGRTIERPGFLLVACALKMPQLAMPVRVLVMGSAHTPSLDAVLELFERDKVLARLKTA